MKIAVVRFPGSNCDQDALWALKGDMGIPAEYVWHEDTSLAGFDGVFIPGGFTYGDYLRCGAIAARSPIMAEVKRMAEAGAPVLGACNGFQILCEAGILPGALMQNAGQRFVCKRVFLKAESKGSPWTAPLSEPVEIPIAHGEGRYAAPFGQLDFIQKEGLIAFRYCGPNGEELPESNPNGSEHAIAGLVNKAGNVLGLMPHPERATNKLLGSDAGKMILLGFERVIASSRALV